MTSQEKLRELLDENKRTQAPFLDLGRLSLTEFPEEVCEHVWLEELNLGMYYYDEEDNFIKSKNSFNENKIKSLPANIDQLTNLRGLFLSGNKIEDYSFLSGLTNLTSLYLNNNKIEDIQFLSGLTNLTSLSLSFNQIEDIRFLSGMTNLTRLDLSDNQIEDIRFLSGLTNLTSLDLSSNQIEDIRFLSGMTNLTSLDLTFNQIEDIRFLSGLTNLTSLSLSYCKIEDIRFLSGLTNLTSLYLSGNKIEDYSFLSSLPKLTSLYLSYCKTEDIRFLSTQTELIFLGLISSQIEDYSFLKSLTNLTDLLLISSQIEDCSFLSGMTNLTSLYLSYNKIEDIRFLSGLTNLTILDLSDNQIEDYSFLSGLTNLTSLDLKNNQIEDIRFLSGLTNLTSLKLSGNQIEDIRFLSGLTNLTSLDLSGNQIEDIRFLSGLTNLTSLYLSYNKIEDIRFLSGLTNLTSLYLSDNQIEDYSFLSGLTNLTSLYLSDNQIEDYSFLSGLTNLTSLDLSDNQIEDIRFLSGLTNLTSLDLSDNQLSDHEFLYQWIKGVNNLELSLSNNPINSIPLEIINQNNCFHDLKNWAIDLEVNPVKNHHLKLILIGNGRVGKTSIVKALLGEPHDEKEKSSHGIIRRSWYDKLQSEKGESLKIDIWDFGGQQIYHGTHRIFMQSRALFLVVWDADSENTPIDEEGYDNYKLNYWLDYIRIFSKDSPVLVVRNKIDEPSSAVLPLSKEEYQKTCNIQQFWEVSAREGTGIANLKSFIEEAFQKMPETGRLMPQTWHAVRQQIFDRNAQEDEMSVASFYEICDACEVREVSRKSLLHYLHQSGVLFYHDNHFKNRIILNQKKAIDAIYQLFKRDSLFFDLVKGKGSFQKSNLFQFWELQGIEEPDQDLYYRLMKSTELFFSLDDEDEENSTLYSPQLLPEEKPLYVIKKWERIVDDTLYVRYEHAHFHAGIIDRFIVRVSHLAETADSFWKNGISIIYKSSDALIEAQKIDQKWELNIRVNGREKEELLIRIKKEFAAIYPNGLTFDAFGSFNGESWVALSTLKEQKDRDKEWIINSEGDPVKTADYSIFLQTELPEKARFVKEREEGLETILEKDSGGLLGVKPTHQRKSKPSSDVHIYVAYATEDQEEKEAFLTFLNQIPSTRNWDRSKIILGSNVSKAVEKEVQKADIYLPLISKSFSRQETYNENGFELAKERFDQGQLRIIPIYLKPCIGIDEFQQDQCLPRDGRPLEDWKSSDKYWTAIVRELMKVVDLIRLEKAE